MKFLSFLYTVSCYLHIIKQFYLFPFNLDAFYLFFSYLIVVARTMLSRSSERGHSHLILEFSGKAFSFSPLSIILAVGWS